MPRSWCYEVLLVRTDAQNNLYCEMNFIGTGCNWRPADQRGANVPNPGWFKIPNDWIGYSDWASLAWYDTHNDNCAPFCSVMKPKNQYLNDQDGQGVFLVTNPALRS